MAVGIEEFLHPSSRGAFGPGYEEAKKGRLSTQDDMFSLNEWKPYIPIRRNSSATPSRELWKTRTRLGVDTHSDQQMARFALPPLSWQVEVAHGADLAERGESLPYLMRKRRCRRYPADRGTPSQCRSHRERNGCRRLGCWRQISFCFLPSPQQQRSVYKGVE